MNVCIILAAGSSSRMKNQILPKQLISINGKPLICYSLETFLNHPLIDKVAVVYNSDYEDLFFKIFKEYPEVRLIKGGSTRQESSYLAIKAFEELQDDDIVLIHDAARVLINDKIITENIAECLKNEAVVTALKVDDTMIEGETHLEKTLNRERLFFEQTPQTFKYRFIKQAHETAKQNNICNLSDEAQLMKLIDKKVVLVQGDKKNFKVTTLEDLKLLKFYLEEAQHGV